MYYAAKFDLRQSPSAQATDISPCENRVALRVVAEKGGEQTRDTLTAFLIPHSARE